MATWLRSISMSWKMLFLGIEASGFRIQAEKPHRLGTASSVVWGQGALGDAGDALKHQVGVARILGLWRGLKIGTSSPTRALFVRLW